MPPPSRSLRAPKKKRLARRLPKRSAAPVAPRPRNATATRDAILASARAAFARAGYDGAGVREIAGAVGVSPMLVNRYFGSKEGLFAEVVRDTMAHPHVLSRDNLASNDVPARFAETLVALTGTASTPLDGFQILLRSASSPRAAEIGRTEIERGHQHVLASALVGPHAAERAAIVLSLVAGVQMMRQMLRLGPLATAEPGVLEALLTPALRSLLAPSPEPSTAR